MLYASKLAAVAGMNPYCSQDELANEFRAKVIGVIPDGYMNPDEKADAAISALPLEARNAVKRAIASATTCGNAAEATAIRSF